MVQDRIPQGGRWQQSLSSGSTGLLEVVSQAVLRASVGGLAGAGTDSSKRSSSAPGRDSAIGQALLQPVLSQLIPLLIGQVPGCGCLQQAVGKIQAVPEAPRIHSRFDQGPGGRGSGAIALKQRWRTGQELGDAPVLGVGSRRI